MSRTATWAGIGSDVTEMKTLDDVLNSAGLNFEVEKRPLYTRNAGKLIKIDGTVSTVRKDTGDVLGIVGDKYQVCQNRDAFDFINYIDDDVKFVKAGITYSGLVYVIAELPQVTILDDGFKPYVIFQNGFNGGISIKAAICPLRIVCQNQFNMAFKESNSYVSIRHNTTMEQKLIQARDVLKATASYMSSINETAQSLAADKLPESQFIQIVDKMFEIKPEMSVRQQNQILARRDRLIFAYHADDNANFRGTAWGAVNAYSDFLTHVEPTRMTKNYDENHFMHVSFSSDSMDRFIRNVEAHVA